MLVGLIVALVSAWQLDIVVSSVINAFYDAVKDLKLWMPCVPPFSWEATYWTFPDAYVRFFVLMWIGFFIALFALWFWEDN